MLLYRVYIVVLILLGSVPLLAQRYSITHYTSKEGLAQNENRVLLKDFRGNIWAGTRQGGLSRFDGQKFINYSTRNGLADNFIYGMVQDAQQFIWIATGNGISRFDGEFFTNYLTSENNRTLISAITVDSLDNIWFFQKGKGLGKMSPSGELEYIYFPSLNTRIANALYADSQNRVWIATQKAGVFLYDGEWQHFDLEKGLNTNETFSFLETSDGDILVGTALGVNILRGKQFGTAAHFAFLAPLPVHHIAEDAKGRLWFATMRGAWLYNRENIVQVSTNNGLTEEVFAIQPDNEGGLFFATAEGIFRWNNDVFALYDADHGLIGERVYSCAATPDSTIWISTENGVGYIKNSEVIVPENLPFLLSEQRVPIVADAQGNVYFGTSASVHRYNGDSFEFVFREDDLQEGEKFTCGLVTRSQEVFFAGTNGICQYKEGKLFTHLPKRLLKGFIVTALQEDPNGNLLIGTNGGGVFRYRKGKLEQFGKRKGFPNGVINTMLYDTRGNLWLGTSGNGIMKVPEGNLERDVVTFDDLPIASSNVYSIIADEFGDLWTGTDRGLSRIKVLQNDYVKVVNYFEREGFSPLEVYPNAICKSPDGNLWIGTIEGIVEVNPNEKVFTAQPPNVYFEGLHLFFETTPWTDYTDSVDRWTGMPHNLVLPNHKNHLQFKFVGVSMNLPSEVTYQWQLEGLDQTWTPPSKRSEAIYTNIPPGNYTFKVKACNAGGVCNDIPTSFTFEITKPFYQTRSFIVLMLLASGALLYFFFRVRLKQLEKSQYLLQQKVKERTMEIETQKAEIEAQSDKLEAAVFEIEEKNKELKRASEEMVNSLTYAGRIQSAILSYKKEFKEFFPNSFILSLNKKIVAGDFIWLKKRGDYTYVAMVDCTGNGVPAAFMSIIGYDSLNHVIEHCEDDEPATLLNRLNTRVISALHVEGNTDLNDGMDIAMCRIHHETREMVFAGARRPIILVSPKGELETIKGEFFSVGIHYNGIEANFKQHTLSIQEGSTIYLFSDGFQNQFNGAGKKYKFSNFRKLLVRVNEYDMKTQMDILKDEFLRWKGDEEQIDDVFVAGFQF